ncbi:MAG: alpha/beta hydrolase [Planctomycetota bacterium]|nr:MAG: alpha/beta hydrolase [Planctomycetota bacterium]
MRRPSSAFLALSIIALLASTTVSRADEVEVDYKPDVTYATVGDEELQMDIASPKGLDHPVPGIVVIHGGGWRGGKRQDMATLAKELAAHGYVAATVSYRLAPTHPFPAQVEDVKAAVRYLRANAKDLNIDPERIGATGGSAGGHLSLMLGTMDSSDGLEGDGGNADQSSKVQAVVNFVGPFNLIMDEYTPTQTAILSAFVGGAIDEKKEACRLASPVTYVNEGDAPTLSFYGTDDPLIPNDQAFQVATAMDDADIPGRVEILVGQSHGWIGEEMERTVEATVDFFDEHLKK